MTKPTRSDAYSIYKKIAELEGERAEHLARATAISNMIAEKKVALGTALAEIEHGITRGAKVRVIWTPLDRNMKPTGQTEAFVGRVVSCAAATPVSPIEVSVLCTDAMGKTTLKTFFPNGREYSFAVVGESQKEIEL